MVLKNELDLIFWLDEMIECLGTNEVIYSA